MANRTQREIGKLAGDLGEAEDVEVRRSAVTRLRDIGFAQRLSLEKRGTLALPAETALPDDQLEALHAALGDDDREVRLHAISSAGDFGDVRSVPTLIAALEEDDEDIRLAAIGSLGDVGGAESLSALTSLAADPGEAEEIRLAALSELEELAAKRITSGPDRRFDPPAAGSAAAQPDPDEPEDATRAKEELRAALERIRAEHDSHGLLRLKAGDILTYLDSGAG
jgi:HEAT repeat protein